MLNVPPCSQVLIHVVLIEFMPPPCCYVHKPSFEVDLLRYVLTHLHHPPLQSRPIACVHVAVACDSLSQAFVLCYTLAVNTMPE